MKKLIKKLLKEAILNEGKQVGPIYHFTRINYILPIISMNRMRVNSEDFKFSGVDATGISMTRDKNFWNSGRSVGGTDVRLEFNGDAISNDYKVVPFNAFTMRTRDSDFPEYNESEERIVIQNKPFAPLKYLTGVSINLDRLLETSMASTPEDTMANFYKKLQLIWETNKLCKKVNVPIKTHSTSNFDNNELITDTVKQFIKRITM
jgi:hypothetical protein